MTKAEKTLAIMQSNKKRNETEGVLRYLIQNDTGITGLEALRMFGTYRLSAIIYNLRHTWHLDIETVPEGGSGSQDHARYFLAKEEEAQDA